MALDTRQLKACEMLSRGESIQKVADTIGVNRKTVSAWTKKEEFNAEVERLRAFKKSDIEKEILQHLNPLMDRMFNIAMTSESDKTSLDACIYLINRVAGTPTNKIQDVSENKATTEVEDIDILLKSIEEDSKVIQLPEKKAK